MIEHRCLKRRCLLASSTTPLKDFVEGAIARIVVCQRQRGRRRTLLRPALATTRELRRGLQTPAPRLPSAPPHRRVLGLRAPSQPSVLDPLRPHTPLLPLVPQPPTACARGTVCAPEPVRPRWCPPAGRP